MKKFSKNFHLPVIIILFLLCVFTSCKKTKNESHLSEIPPPESLVALTSDILDWTLKNNERCELDMTDQGSSSSSNCFEIISKLEKLSGPFSEYFNQRVVEATKGVTDPQEIAKLTNEVSDSIGRDILAAALTSMRIDDDAKLKLVLMTVRAINGDLRHLRPAYFLALYQSLSPLFSAEKIRKILNEFSPNPALVRYNGESSMLEFSDNKLRDDVHYLAGALAFSVKMFEHEFSVLSADKKALWTFDSNDDTGASRVEPYDLLLVAAKTIYRYQNSINSSFEMNPIVLGKLTGSALDRVLGRESHEDPMHISLFRDDFSPMTNDAIIVCGGSEPLMGYSDGVFRKIMSNGINTSDSLLKISRQEAAFFAGLSKEKPLQCAGKKYSFESNVLGGGKPIPRPVWPKLKNVKALFTTALLREMNQPALWGAIAYLQSRGYTVAPVLNEYGVPELWQTVPDLAQDYLKEAESADILVPAAHSTNMNRVDLGSDQALKLNAIKYIRQADGTLARIQMVFYVPPFDGQSTKKLVSLEKERLADLLTARSKKLQTPLVVLSTSCFSERTLMIWMRAFDNAQQMAGDSNIPAPYVIGARRGFATDSTLNILSHFDFPLGVIDRLGQASSEDEVINYLKTVPQTPQRAILQYAQKFLKISSIRQLADFDFWRAAEPGFDQSFDPITNLEQSFYWDGTKRLEMILQNTEDETDRLVF